MTPEPNMCTTLSGPQRRPIDHRDIIHPGILRPAPRETQKFQPDEPPSNPGRFTQTLGYDPANRHMSTVAGATNVTYTRDAGDRIISRSETGATTGYGFAGPSDSPAFTTGLLGIVVDRFVGLVGGVTLTKRGAGDTWSYPNVHGDVVASANASGVKQGATLSYDPYGVALGAVPDNSSGNFDFGWLGQPQRGLEHAPGITPTIEMGARPYVPSMGRFLEADPVEGGSANDYDYCSADPVNCTDIDGTIQLPGPAQAAWCATHGAYACGVARWTSRRAKAAASDVADVFGSEAGNAFQHAYWMGLVAYWVGGDAAFSLGFAHEIDNQVSCCGDSALEARKDMMNNWVGIGHGQRANLPGSVYRGVRRSFDRGDLFCLADGEIQSC